MSGFGADTGQGDLNGVTMAQDEINQSGGILGHPVELVVEDFGSETARAVSAYQKLVNVERVSAVIGPNYTEFTEVVFPVADKARVPTIATSGYPKETLLKRLGQPFFSFTLWPPLEAGMKPILSELSKRRISKLAVINAENAYYESLANILTSAISTGGGSVRRFTVRPDEFDLHSVLANVKAFNPEGIAIFLSETGQIAAFFRQADELGLKIPVFGENHITDDAMLAKRLSLAEGTTFFRYSAYGSDEFKAKYTQRFGNAPKFTAAKGYDALYIFKDTIERCGLEASSIRDCLAPLTYQGKSGTIQFDEIGALSVWDGFTTLATIRNGKIEPLQR